MTARLRVLYPTLAALAQDPLRVRPTTYFPATVNAAASTAAEPVIKVVCPGPVILGETGHPISGQFVEVEAVVPPTPLPPQIGFTGSAARQIDALFSSP